MENHPIPQNVTGFEFKLIGNMTIKQFAYLATGVILAWIIVASPLPILVKFPLGFMIGFIGFALAFIPIDGRPLDAMTAYFIKALFTPNQYVFQKGTLEKTSFNYPSPITTPHYQSAPKQPLATTVSSPTSATIILQQPTEISAPLLILKEKQNLEAKQNHAAPAPMAAPTVPAPQSTMQPAQTNPKNIYDELIKQLTQTQTDKNKLEQELLELKQILAQQPNQTTRQPTQNTFTTPTAPIRSSQSVLKKIAPIPSQNTTGLPISNQPNILIGIVKDPRGNILPNILVEVKDSNHSPVRAFKTNALGQFASATSLLNGVYTLEFEDPQSKHTFETLELSMTGEVIGQIEVVSIDQREELRKALFNQ